MFDAVIFDFDGVLYNSEPLHLKACNTVFKPYQIAIDEDQYYKNYVGLSDQELFPIILASANYPYHASMISELVNLKVAEFKRIIHQDTTFTDNQTITVVLDHLLKANKKLAICSGATRDEIVTVLSKLEDGKMAPYFKTIISINDVSMGKPSPQGYQLTSERLNVPPHRCLVIEDTPTGIKAAKAAGMFVAGLVGTHTQDQLTAADIVIHHLSELMNNTLLLT